MDLLTGRYTARIERPLVLFLIGMRINRLSAVRKWWPVAQAMPAMLAELKARPGSGYLSGNLWGGRTTVAVQYWRSFDDLLAYAHDKSGKHFPAWARFNREVGKDGTVGIWHETYAIEPGKFETLYGNMPRFGLGAAAGIVPAEGRLAGAKDRFEAAVAHGRGAPTN